MMGPIDYVVVSFEGNNFDGSILEELSKSVNSGVIRLIDLVFIVKDADGNVVAGEIEDQSDDLKQLFNGLVGEDEDLDLITEADIDKVAGMLENNTAAGVLVIEHLWAKGLKKAIVDAGGSLVTDGRIHPEAVEAAVAELAEIKE